MHQLNCACKFQVSSCPCIRQSLSTTGRCSSHRRLTSSRWHRLFVELRRPLTFVFSHSRTTSCRMLSLMHSRKVSSAGWLSMMSALSSTGLMCGDLALTVSPPPWTTTRTLTCTTSTAWLMVRSSSQARSTGRARLSALTKKTWSSSTTPSSWKSTRSTLNSCGSSSRLNFWPKRSARRNWTKKPPESSLTRKKRQKPAGWKRKLQTKQLRNDYFLFEY